MLTLVPLLLSCALACGPEPTCQDTSAIRWFTPGDFAKAQKQAAEERRILMIKGIAFGIDELGATSATKGCW